MFAAARANMTRAHDRSDGTYVSSRDVWIEVQLHGSRPSDFGLDR